MSAAAARGRELAVQAHYNAVARTRLNMAIHHLEIGVAAAHRADMTSEAIEFEEVMGDLNHLLRAWPAPVRDQAVAS